MQTSADGTLFFPEAYAPALAAAGVASAAALWDFPMDAVVKDNFKQRVTGRGWLPLPGGGRREVYLKRYAPPTWRERLKDWSSLKFQAFDALHEGGALLEMRARGIPGPGLVAMGRCPDGRTVVMLEGLSGFVDCRRFLEGLGARGERAAFLRRAGAACAALHNAGLTHQDLYLGHFFVAADGSGPFYLIDVQRMVAAARPATKLAVKDMAEMWVSLVGAGCLPRERLRVWREYARLRGLGRAESRAQLRAARAKAGRIIARAERKIREQRVGYDI